MTSLMAASIIQSPYQRDIQVLAYVVVNDMEKRWAEIAATVSVSMFISSSRKVKRLEFIKTPKNRNVLKVFAFDKNVRVGRYQNATAQVAPIGSIA